MRHTLLIAAAAATLPIMAQTKSPTITYPAAPQTDTVDEYFGMKVPDPYRPLENDTAAATTAWVEAECAVTDAYLSEIPYRSQLRNRLEQLNNYTKRGLPWRGNDGRFYRFVNDGLRNQSVVYRADSPDAEGWEVFLDPNTLSDDGTVALTGLVQSTDGRFTAYTISRSGSDWTEIYVLDTATAQPLPDHIEWAKFTGASWQGDGFYYSAYDRPEAGKEFSNANENHRIYYHRIGTPQSADTLAFEDKEHPLHFHSAYVPESEDYLFVSVAGQGFGNALLMKDLRKADAEWVVIEPSQDYQMSIVDVRDGLIYMLTSLDAPMNRLIAIPLDAPARENWREIVPENPKAVLESAQFAADQLLLSYSQDAATHAYQYEPDGTLVREISFPTFGQAYLSSDTKHPEVFYAFTSFLYPSAVFAYDIRTGESRLLSQPAIDGFDPSAYTTEQVFYPSADGTMIPMFITYRSDLKRDGTNPVYLYGYGGFNISLNPGFSANRLLWLENGGIYAQAGLRGGSEYGERWHEAGTKMQKLNVFNDFIAAAEYLIREGWTSPEHLAIEGGSNGGLLVGAVTNMRPDLFAVAIPRVGVMDMMRYHLFTIGWNWAPDYGTSADSPEMAAYLLGYSPLHNIRNDGTPYPAIMVTTADHDDRVVPAHSFKYAAALQAADTGSKPKIIRIDSKAGHGAGKPISKVLDEYADLYSFIFQNLGITPKND